MNRRKLLQGTLAGATTIAFGGGFLQFITPSAGAQATPIPQIDQLRFAMQALPPQLDPQVGYGSVSQRMYPFIFDTLIKQDWANGGALVPALATSWSRPDDLTLDMELRQGVLFQDGSPFTAADVKFTIERTTAGDTTLAYNNYFGNITVNVIDDYHVQLKTETPVGALEMLLAQISAGSIVPEAYFNSVGKDAFLTAPIGTGTHKLTEFVLDSHASFEVNPNYWGGASPVQKIVVSNVPEVSTRIAALYNGEYDIITDVPVDQVETITKQGAYNITEVAQLAMQVALIQGDKPPFDNVKVRQAASLAIDRQTIVEQILAGHGVWPGSNQVKEDPLYVPRDPLPYDPEKAKSLLAEAGYNGEEIIWDYREPAYYPLEDIWTQAAAQNLIDVGFNVTLSPQPSANYGDGEYNLINAGDDVILDQIMSRAYGTNTSYITKRFPPDTFKDIRDLVLQAEQITDADERKAAYAHIEDLINEQVPEIVLFQINRITACQPNIVWHENPDNSITFGPDTFSVS